MIQHIINFIERLVLLGRGRIWILYGIVLILVVTPAATTRIINYQKLEQDLTSLTLARRESVAVSVAQALEAQLRRVADYTRLLSIHPLIRDNIAAGQWEEAITVADTSLELTVEPMVERILLADVHGVLQADAPTLAGIHGADVRGLPWYPGVIESQETFVTPVFKRTAQPDLNVIAVASPITNDQNEFIGIIASHVTLEALAGWIKAVNLHSNGFAYVVDQTGQIVTHPDYPPQDAIVDFSTFTPVQRVLAGKTGTVSRSHRTGSSKRNNSPPMLRLRVMGGASWFKSQLPVPLRHSQPHSGNSWHWSG